MCSAVGERRENKIKFVRQKDDRFLSYNVSLQLSPLRTCHWKVCLTCFFFVPAIFHSAVAIFLSQNIVLLNEPKVKLYLLLCLYSDLNAYKDIKLQPTVEVLHIHHHSFTKTCFRLKGSQNLMDQILATWFFSSGSEFLSGIFLFFIFFLFFSGWFLVINTNSEHLLNVLISTAKGPYSTKYQSMPFPFVTPEWASVFITTSWPVICPRRSCKGGIQAVCRWSNCGKTLCSTLEVFIIMLFFNHPFFNGLIQYTVVSHNYLALFRSFSAAL